jgi:hypothetical protein
MLYAKIPNLIPFLLIYRGLFASSMSLPAPTALIDELFSTLMVFINPSLP